MSKPVKPPDVDEVEADRPIVFSLPSFGGTCVVRMSLPASRL